jgi:hypothetical protein
MTGNEPWPDDDMIQVAVKVRDEGLTAINQFPKDTPKYLRRLAKWCWMQSPDDRPTFAEIVDFLTTSPPEGVDVAALDAGDDQTAALEAGLRAQKIERRVRRESMRAEKKLQREQSQRKTNADSSIITGPAQQAGGVYSGLPAEDQGGAEAGSGSAVLLPPEEPKVETAKKKPKKVSDESDSDNDDEDNDKKPASSTTKRASSSSSKRSSSSKGKSATTTSRKSGGGGGGRDRKKDDDGDNEGGSRRNKPPPSPGPSGGTNYGSLNV